MSIFCRMIGPVLVLISWSCSDDSSKSAAPGSGGSGDSNLEVVFKSTTLANASLAGAALQAGSCTVDTPTGNQTGYCISPLNVSGGVSQVNMASTTGGVGGGVRILGGGDTVSGFATYFDYKPFDFSDQPGITGDDNIQDGSSSTSYNYIGMQFSHLDTKFEAAGKFWTVRQVFLTQPISEETAFADCGLDGLSTLDQVSIVIEDMEFRRGDILVCQKSSATAACEASDYLWVDPADSNALTATRPDSPAQIEGLTNMLVDFSCSVTASNGIPDVRIDGLEVNADLTSNITDLSASYTRGVKEYVFNGETGNKLTVTIDINADDSLFFPIDPASADEADILSNIGAIMLKPLVIRGHTSDGAETGAFGISANVSLALETVEID